MLSQFTILNEPLAFYIKSAEWYMFTFMKIQLRKIWILKADNRVCFSCSRCILYITERWTRALMKSFNTFLIFSLSWEVHTDDYFGIILLAFSLTVGIKPKRYKQLVKWPWNIWNVIPYSWWDIGNRRNGRIKNHPQQCSWECTVRTNGWGRDIKCTKENYVIEFLM